MNAYLVSAPPTLNLFVERVTTARDPATGQAFRRCVTALDWNAMNTLPTWQLVSPEHLIALALGCDATTADGELVLKGKTMTRRFSR